MAALGELAIALLKPEFKPFDFYFLNHFLTLNGHKFSTSRQFALFVDDIISCGIHSDILRLFLASCDLIADDCDFNFSHFEKLCSKINFFCHRLQCAIDRLSTFHGSISPASDDQRNQFEEILNKQKTCLSLTGLDLKACVDYVLHWLEREFDLFHMDLSELYHWLHASAQLLHPYMPRTASQISLWLGYLDLPFYSDWGNSTQFMPRPVQMTLPVCNTSSMLALKRHIESLYGKLEVEI
jgi:methionyl-tRNA synthetase